MIFLVVFRRGCRTGHRAVAPSGGAPGELTSVERIANYLRMQTLPNINILLSSQRPTMIWHIGYAQWPVVTQYYSVLIYK